MKKILSICLSVILICSLAVQPVKAQTSSNEKPDVTISSVRELNEFALKVNNGNNYSGKLIKLTNDIKFDGVTVNNFVPIGYNESCQFKGTFDGGGYTISGIDITDMGNMYDNLGLFGYIGEGAIVRNIMIKSTSMTSNEGEYIGAIAGVNLGDIINCSSNVAFIAKNTYIGGIAGSNAGEVRNCSSNSNIAASPKEVKKTWIDGGYGGLIGLNSGKLYNSFNTGSISINGEDNAEAYIGGLVGRGQSSSDIQNCYNTGMITGNGFNAGLVGCAEGIVANSFCSTESAEQNIFKLDGVEKNNKALSVSEMKISSFTNMLNTNIGSNTSWLKWIDASTSEYPTLITQNEVTFGSIKNGVVKTNRSYAYKEQTVSLTVTPNKNYKISKVAVKIPTGKSLAVTKKNGKYQFKMPDAKVIVSATFVKSK